MTGRNARLVWVWALTLTTIAAGATRMESQAPSNGPVQMTREEDHARTMKLLGLAAMPRGAASASLAFAARYFGKPGGRT